MSDNLNNPNIKQEPTNITENQQLLENLAIKSEPETQTETGGNTAPATTQISSRNSTPKPSTSTAQPSARKFVPNLGIERVKRDPNEESDKSREQKQPRRPHAPNLNASRGARGGRGGRGGQSNLIQSHSIFEAGSAESTKRFGRPQDASDSYSKVIGAASSSGGGGSSTIDNISVSARTFKQSEDQDDSKMKIEDSLILEEYKEKDSAVYVKLKYDAKENDLETEESINKEAKQLKDLFETNEDQKEKLILFQIPEHLCLQDLEEGHIGKLRVRKSGRVELVFNDDKYFDVSMSVAGDFLQDAVALQMLTQDGKEESGTMTNLGHVLKKVVCSPKIES